MTRTEILNIIKTHLLAIDGGVSSIRDPFTNEPYSFECAVHDSVHSRFVYLEEINNFPTVCFYPVEESFQELEAGIRYRILTINIRGYVYAEHDETYNSIWWAEALLDDIEHVLSGLALINPCIIEARFLSLSTDQGFMAPYGVADAIFQVIYESTNE